MADTQIPSEISEQLADGAQNYFAAAYKSAQENGLSEQAALDVAWNSIKENYEKAEDGKWHRKPDAPNATRKAVQSGGN